ncbi:hypothetical protein ADUPG1_006754 [Aduncisulcus paluster]|uniref:Uncharacterized protein n=1 Tax=Aduncisulcus paluster TaxID=2918883 RepID=A0ABQ5KJF4_9EUKA|nr:hypothetical protein ADUPG1_006754 [Aduncisulcus paluster]
MDLFKQMRAVAQMADAGKTTIVQNSSVQYDPEAAQFFLPSQKPFLTQEDVETSFNNSSQFDKQFAETLLKREQTPIHRSLLSNPKPVSLLAKKRHYLSKKWIKQLLLAQENVELKIPVWHGDYVSDISSYEPFSLARSHIHTKIEPLVGPKVCDLIFSSLIPILSTPPTPLSRDPLFPSFHVFTEDQAIKCIEQYISRFDGATIDRIEGESASAARKIREARIKERKQQRTRLIEESQDKSFRERVGKTDPSLKSSVIHLNGLELTPTGEHVAQVRKAVSSPSLAHLKMLSREKEVWNKRQADRKKLMDQEKMKTITFTPDLSLTRSKSVGHKRMRNSYMRHTKSTYIKTIGVTPKRDGHPHSSSSPVSPCSPGLASQAAVSSGSLSGKHSTIPSLTLNSVDIEVQRHCTFSPRIDTDESTSGRRKRDGPSPIHHSHGSASPVTRSRSQSQSQRRFPRYLDEDGEESLSRHDILYNMALSGRGYSTYQSSNHPDSAASVDISLHPERRTIIDKAVEDHKMLRERRVSMGAKPEEPKQSVTLRGTRVRRRRTVGASSSMNSSQPMFLSSSSVPYLLGDRRESLSEMSVSACDLDLQEKGQASQDGRGYSTYQSSNHPDSAASVDISLHPERRTIIDKAVEDHKMLRERRVSMGAKPEEPKQSVTLRGTRVRRRRTVGASSSMNSSQPMFLSSSSVPYLLGDRRESLSEMSVSACDLDLQEKGQASQELPQQGQPVTTEPSGTLQGKEEPVDEEQHRQTGKEEEEEEEVDVPEKVLTSKLRSVMNCEESEKSTGVDESEMKHEDLVLRREVDVFSSIPRSPGDEKFPLDTELEKNESLASIPQAQRSVIAALFPL